MIKECTYLELALGKSCLSILDIAKATWVRSLCNSFTEWDHILLFLPLLFTELDVDLLSGSRRFFPPKIPLSKIPLGLFSPPFSPNASDQSFEIVILFKIVQGSNKHASRFGNCPSRRQGEGFIQVARC